MAKISPSARRFLDPLRGVVSDSVFRRRDQGFVGIGDGRICGTAAGVHGDGLGDRLQREPLSMSALWTRIRARTLVRAGFDGAALQFLQTSVVGWLRGYEAAGNAELLTLYQCARVNNINNQDGIPRASQRESEAFCLPGATSSDSVRFTRFT